MTGSSQVPISMPATGDQPDERKKPGGGVFLGGPLSAMLLSLCFLEHDGILERTIPWFSLIPLFISLDRHRRNLKWRVMHGLFFGLILYCWPLVSWSEPPNLVTVWTSLVMMGSWMLFCAAGGALLRYPSRLTVVPGLATLWTGLEFLRSECIPASVPWMQLGQTLKPESPEGQFAAVIGLAGLGFAICLVNGAFFLTLREKRWRVQFFAALAGTGAVVGLLISGGLVGSRTQRLEQPPRETLRIGLVQTGGGGNSEHLKLARQLLNSEPQLIFFPGNAFMPTPGKSSIPAELEVFAREEGIEMLVAGMSLDPDDKSEKSRTLLYSAGGGGHGEIEAARDDNIFVPRPGPVFVRGDVNGDSQINMQDAIAIVQWWNQQLQSGPPQWQPSCCPWTTNFPCHDAADANDDGYLTPEDALAIIRYLWANAMLSPPSSISLNYIASDCGEDLTEDDLGCDVESAVCN